MTDRTEDERLATRFEQHRARLGAVAYRMLGSISEAEDAVQDAWLRLHRVDTTEVANLDAAGIDSQVDDPVLREQSDIDRDRWRQSLQDLDEPRRQMRQTCDLARRSQHGNIRSRLWSRTQHGLLELAGTLERCCFLIEDVSVISPSSRMATRPILGRSLRGPTADTLEDLAGVLAHQEDALPDAPSTRGAHESVNRLLHTVEASQFHDALSHLLAGAVTVSVRRALLTIAQGEDVEALADYAGLP